MNPEAARRRADLDPCQEGPELSPAVQGLFPVIPVLCLEVPGGKPELVAVLLELSVVFPAMLVIHPERPVLSRLSLAARHPRSVEERQNSVG